MSSENLNNAAALTAEQINERKEAASFIDFKMVTFDLAGKDYGIDIMHVKEIAKAGRFTYVPNTAPFVLGVYNLRGEIIPILDLRIFFNIPEPEDVKECYIVIVGTQEKKIGVMVDTLIGEEDVVIKPLKDKFTESPGIAGASILGDGSVSLIIDVSQLLELGVRQEIIAQQQEFVAE